ncbi:hypothetical protein B296_00054363 [Ensete ventricosum]|uniref:Uncharacterized protein n=1 Tax=Ensete ventricosum TaxID=4639 RepID=A0A426Y453_ENSVE|nr:hypothetical protein B296_00054363 [Ensete ventricosum]
MISTVTEAYWSICLSVVGEGIFKVLRCIIDTLGHTEATYWYVPYQVELNMLVQTGRGRGGRRKKEEEEIVEKKKVEAGEKGRGEEAYQRSN